MIYTHNIHILYIIYNIYMCVERGSQTETKRFQDVQCVQVGHFIKNYKLNYLQSQWSRPPPPHAVECWRGMSSKKGHIEVLCLEIKLWLSVFSPASGLQQWQNKSSVAQRFIAAHARLSTTKNSTRFLPFLFTEMRCVVDLEHDGLVVILSNPPEPKVCVSACLRDQRPFEFITGR